jgi:hypothetical protein
MTAQGKIKINVKGYGQECPSHIGKGNINVNSGTAGFRGSHLSQRTRKMGHPLHFLRRWRWRVN